MATESTFTKLYATDISAKINKKMGLSYLGWADAWAELKKLYPDAMYKIYTRTVKETITTVSKEGEGDNAVTTTTVMESENEIPYFTDGMTCYVKVGVTVQGHEETETYPIMDNKNNAVPLALIKSTIVNKALQRAFVKACARHGLGLYIYSGEDLPEDKRLPSRNELIKEANRVTYSPIDNAELFTNRKNKAIAYLKTQSEHIDPALYRYIQVELFPGKKLSALTQAEDSVNLQKLNYIVDKVLAVTAS